jgi:hypothetical protein
MIVTTKQKQSPIPVTVLLLREEMIKLDVQMLEVLRLLKPTFVNF